MHFDRTPSRAPGAPLARLAPARSPAVDCRGTLNDAVANLRRTRKSSATTAAAERDKRFEALADAAAQGTTNPFTERSDR